MKPFRVGALLFGISTVTPASVGVFIYQGSILPLFSDKF